jgi:hypothetical protein
MIGGFDVELLGARNPTIYVTELFVYKDEEAFRSWEKDETLWSAHAVGGMVVASGTTTSDSSNRECPL